MFWITQQIGLLYLFIQCHFNSPESKALVSYCHSASSGVHVHISLVLWHGIQHYLTGSKISTSSTKFVFLGTMGKTNGLPCLWSSETFFDFSPLTAERNSTRIDRNQDLNVLHQVCVLRQKWKSRLPPRPLIGWDIFDFSSETAEQNPTKPYKKQALNVLYHVCVFRADRKKTRWPPWPLIGWDIIFTSHLKPLNGIQRILTGSKILISSTQFLFSDQRENKDCRQTSDCLRHFLLLFWNGPIGKTRWPTWPLISWDIFDFSETLKRNSTKLDRKQDFNVLYPVCVFSGRSKK